MGNKLWETNLAGLKTDFGLDGLYRVKRKSFPALTDGRRYFEEYVTDAVGNRRSFRDANGRLTSYDYDALNRPSVTTNALGQVTLTRYDDPEGSHVHKSSEEDTTRGLRTTFLYDALGRETERKVHLLGASGDGRVYTTISTYSTAGGGQQVTVTGEDSHETIRTLDGLDRVVSETVRTNSTDGDLVTTTAYDGLGNKTVVTDPRDNATHYQYDGLGRMTQMQDALGGEASYGYDEGGLKIYDKDRRGIERAFSYDNLGRLTESRLVSAPKSGVAWSHTTQYRDRARQRIEIDARGHSTVSELDEMDRVVREIDAEGRAAEFHYDGVNKDWQIDRRGRRTSFGYDVINRLTSTQYPGSTSTESIYQDALNLRRDRNRRNHWTETQSDPLGRVVRITREAVAVENNDYDAHGNKTRAEDGEGRVTTFGYDGANRLISRVDGAGTAEVGQTRFIYSQKGGQLDEKDPRASGPFSLRKTFDELGRLSSETDGELHVTSYRYDGEGNRTLVRDPKLQETAFAYDELGKLLTVTQPMVEGVRPVTRHRYDPNRNRIRQTDANEHVVQMEYDRLNRLFRTTQDPDLGGLRLVTHITEFDGNGNVVRLVDPKGQQVHNTYDELNRLTQRDFAALPAEAAQLWRHTTSIHYTYDGNDNLETATESVASGTDPPSASLVTSRTYDAFDRLSSETEGLAQGGTRTLGYDYYGNGLRKTKTDSGRVTRYEYDGRNRLAAVTTDFGTAGTRTTSYGYWPDSLLHTVSTPNGVVATHTYDEADRLSSLTNTRSGTTVSSYAYDYDDNGNRTSQIETNDGLTETTTYTFDALDRLASITYPIDTTYPSGRVVTYGYDAVGNRIRETERNQAAALLADKRGVFDNANRLTSLQDSFLRKTRRCSPGTPTATRPRRRWARARRPATCSTPATSWSRSRRAPPSSAASRTTSTAAAASRSAKTASASTSTTRRACPPSTTRPAAETARYDYGSDRLLSLDASRRRPPLLLARRPAKRRQPDDGRGHERSPLPPGYLGQLSLPERTRPTPRTASASQDTSSTPRPGSITPRPATTTRSSAAS